MTEESAREREQESDETRARVCPTTTTTTTTTTITMTGQQISLPCAACFFFAGPLLTPQPFFLGGRDGRDAHTALLKGVLPRPFREEAPRNRYYYPPCFLPTCSCNLRSPPPPPKHKKNLAQARRAKCGTHTRRTKKSASARAAIVVSILI